MSKQTAVEWMVNGLLVSNYISKDSKVMNEFIKKAKALEREQIIDAYYYGATDVEVIDDLADAKLYYDETYKK